MNRTYKGKYASVFDSMTQGQRKVLGTLWVYQRMHSPKYFEVPWGFAMDTEDKDYLEYQEAVPYLVRSGYVYMNPPCPTVFLTKEGTKLMYNVGDRASEDFYVTFDSDIKPNPLCPTSLNPRK